MWVGCYRQKHVSVPAGQQENQPDAARVNDMCSLKEHLWMIFAGAKERKDCLLTVSQCDSESRSIE